MAIKKKGEPKDISLPPKLDGLLLKGFTEQFMSSYYEGQFKDTKKEVEGYLDSNSDGFDVEKGVGFKSQYGSVIYTGRENLNVDKDKIIELIESGELTVAQLLASVSSFKKDELKGTLAGHYDDVVTITETEYLTFKGSPDFKAKCEAQLNIDQTEAKVIAKETIRGAKEELRSIEKLSSAEKAKLAKAKVSAKKLTKKSPDADLDAILGKKG